MEGLLWREKSVLSNFEIPFAWLAYLIESSWLLNDNDAIYSILYIANLRSLIVVVKSMLTDMTPKTLSGNETLLLCACFSSRTKYFCRCTY